jgi:hypothetical protein
VNDGPPVDPRDAGAAAAEAGCRGRGGVVLGSDTHALLRAIKDNYGKHIK